MIISTKGRYALRLMIDLARHKSAQEWIPLKDVSQRQNISIKYLEQIIQRLCAANLLKSLRGPMGGYQLTKEPAEYTAGEILRTIEGSLSPVSFADSTGELGSVHMCPPMSFYRGLNDVIDKYVDSFSIQDFLDEQTENYDYYI